MPQVLKSIACLVLLCLVSTTQTHSQSQPAAKEPVDPSNWTYDSKSLARVFGNAGGWWSFMNENEKAAFLDGYRTAMSRAHASDESFCEHSRKELNPTVSKEAFDGQMKLVIYLCGNVARWANYGKVTTKDLDEFYRDPINQPITLEWAMEFLRDKASGAKTEGQLLDALKEEQRDVHDCKKYPNLCKMGLRDTHSSP